VAAGDRVRLGANVFVSAPAADEAEAIALRGEIGAALRPLLDGGEIAGYRAVAVASEEDWDEHDIDRDVLEAVSGGVLPIVYLAISYDADVAAQPGPGVGRVIERFSLQPAYQVSPPAG
jgi:hypothetical protein